MNFVVGKAVVRWLGEIIRLIFSGQSVSQSAFSERLGCESSRISRLRRQKLPIS